MASRVKEYLEKIREREGLKNAILCGITISKKERMAEFFLVTDKTYSLLDEAAACAVSKEFLPEGIEARVKIVKRVPDKNGLQKRIFDYIQNNFPAASAFLDLQDIEVELLSSGANFLVQIDAGEQTLFSSGKILDDVSRYLTSVYCGSFYGNVRIGEKKKKDVSILEEIPESETEAEHLEIRRFPIFDYEKIDGAEETPKTAVYMADCQNVDGIYALCGAITYIEEIEYVKRNEATNTEIPKTRFSITFTDGTSALRTTYFPKKATLEKVRKLAVGDKIVVIGANEEYKGHVSFKASKINYGAPPEKFVPKARKGKPVPKAYHTVFPESYVDYTQTGLFDNLFKPADLKENVFVVFDLETTGLNNNPAMGKMDSIIELGAVKIVNGEMTEKFSTFVACKERLSNEIINLTGIHDEDLVGAPEVEKVMADFFKFTDGAYLVGHNVNFDYRFVRYYGEQNGYMFDKKMYDTLLLAQEVLRGQLPNYKLNSVAGYYGFEFNHHRAFDDACVTAKVFIELVKAKGKLE